MKRIGTGRFVSARLKISEKISSRAFAHYRNKRHLTWGALAQKFAVSEYTARVGWAGARTTIPQKVWEEVSDQRACKLPLSPFWGQRKGGMKSAQHDKSRIPDVFSEDFAEFWGVLLGDGCVYRNQNSFCITCSSVQDRQYILHHLVPLCERLFGLSPKIYFAKHENSIRLVLNSRKIARFLVNLGFPAGEKCNGQLGMPDHFWNKDTLLTACLRGLFDTDGGVFHHPHTGVMLDFTVTHPHLYAQIQRALTKLQLGFGKSRNRFQAYGREKAQKFFSRIGSSNPRNIVRYMHFLQTGEALSAKATGILLKRA
ncbi:hypothetical protein CMO91_04335 [Candidatus Woesearchaeota archaeon]|nr:hypothetical protein [Candidatus Woesearchaeota archaeon]|tara:strand:+ start:198 stop:1136 length:939 start_codon:yes stop_codon:yes gene_type:complete